MSRADYLEPIQFFKESCLLLGEYEDILPENTEVINSLELAMQLETEQQALPNGYQIWTDSIEAAVAPFYRAENNEKRKEGEEFIDAEIEQTLTAVNSYFRELQKKKIKKSITTKESYWLNVSGNIMELLKSISLGRYIFGDDGVPFLENIYNILKAGFYPCGIRKDGGIVAFDVGAWSLVKGNEDD
jgi:hypothetical protein